MMFAPVTVAREETVAFLFLEHMSLKLPTSAQVSYLDPWVKQVSLSQAVGLHARNKKQLP